MCAHQCTRDPVEDQILASRANLEGDILELHVLHPRTQQPRRPIRFRGRVTVHRYLRDSHHVSLIFLPLVVNTVAVVGIVRSSGL